MIALLRTVLALAPLATAIPAETTPEPIAVATTVEIVPAARDAATPVAATDNPIVPAIAVPIAVAAPLPTAIAAINGAAGMLELHHIGNHRFAFDFNFERLYR